MDDESRRRVDDELAKAVRARDEGREGRARVCARRAAGWSLRGYYRDRTGAPAPESALELLRWYRDHAGAPSDLRAAARRLTARVNEDFRLPHGEDPLEDARRLIEAQGR